VGLVELARPAPLRNNARTLLDQERARDRDGEKERERVNVTKVKSVAFDT